MAIEYLPKNKELLAPDSNNILAARAILRFLEEQEGDTTTVVNILSKHPSVARALRLIVENEYIDRAAHLESPEDRLKYGQYIIELIESVENSSQ